jgi:hypothetical protein
MGRNSLADSVAARFSTTIQPHAESDTPCISWMIHPVNLTKNIYTLWKQFFKQK